VDRRLLVIVLTLVVNLIGFGIMIPLLPLYVQAFGASEQVIGLVIATFSLCQLIAAPALGAHRGHGRSGARTHPRGAGEP